MKSSIRKDEPQVYFYIRIYVDDTLVITDNPDLILNKINDYFSLKKRRTGKPTTYLGTDTQERKDSQDNLEF